MWYGGGIWEGWGYGRVGGGVWEDRGWGMGG